MFVKLCVSAELAFKVFLYRPSVENDKTWRRVQPWATGEAPGGVRPGSWLLSYGAALKSRFGL